MENLGDALRRKPRIVLGDFFRTHALGEALKDKRYAKPGTPDSRLARQGVVVAHDPLHIPSLAHLTSGTSVPSIMEALAPIAPPQGCGGPRRGPARWRAPGGSGR